ncbi:uncharacterized protein DUF4397 [Pontibacter ummariensis]|uniref:DUF4397 domain-containing protein n=1 Tax=Pontibacter ummariensis TaxID=1610492 RepID=A0A239AYB1_9BACT|nr:DUF4397 domain-containing protein [Pontibacter ummariensis]PRY16167.1 uncharacterized protein DUF4397 [Pontibacter ummariensis]SNS00341.1 protein of unknown function [Pontibacter ummariensis]
MKNWMKVMVLAMMPLVLLTSCDDDDEELDLLDEQANVMVIHASPDAPAVDLYVDNEQVNTAALNYPNNTGYLQLEEGTRNFKVTAAGAGLGSPVINADVPLVEDMNYSIFAVNTLGNIEPLVLEDNLTEPAEGKAHVRLVHLSPDAPNVDVVVQGGPTLFSNIGFKDATAFMPVDAGTYTLEVQPVGTDNTALTETLTLEEGMIYTVFAKGFLSPPEGNNNTLDTEVIVNN